MLHDRELHLLDLRLGAGISPLSTSCLGAVKQRYCGSVVDSQIDGSLTSRLLHPTRLTLLCANSLASERNRCPGASDSAPSSGNQRAPSNMSPARESRCPWSLRKASFSMRCIHSGKPFRGQRGNSASLRSLLRNISEHRSAAGRLWERERGLVNWPLRCAIVGRAIERHRSAARVDLDFGGSVAPVRALAPPHPATVYSSV